MRTAVLFACFAAGPAWAIPLQLAHQGRLLDAAGAPVEGERLVTFRLYDARDATSPVWAEPMNLRLDGGYFSTDLGANTVSNPLDDAVLHNGPLWLGIQISGSPELSRTPIRSTPVAIRAISADAVAGDVLLVNGGTCAGGPDYGRLRWDGANVQSCGPGGWNTLVGAAQNTWEALPGKPAGFADGIDNDALGALNACANGQVPKYSASAGSWSCGNDDNTQLSATTVRSYVASSAIGLAAGSEVAGRSIATQVGSCAVYNGGCGNGMYGQPTYYFDRVSFACPSARPLMSTMRFFRCGNLGTGDEGLAIQATCCTIIQ